MFWQRIARAIDKVNDKVGTVLAAVVVVMLGIMIYEVVARYVFDSPTTWAWRVNTLLFTGSLVLGGGYVYLHDGHVKIDLLIERLSPAKRRLLHLITVPVFFIFMAIVIWQGWRMASSSVAIREHALGFFKPPLYYNKIAFVVGAVLLLLEGIAILIRTIVGPQPTTDKMGEDASREKNDDPDS